MKTAHFITDRTVLKIWFRGTAMMEILILNLRIRLVYQLASLSVKPWASP